VLDKFNPVREQRHREILPLTASPESVAERRIRGIAIARHQQSNRIDPFCRRPIHLAMLPIKFAGLRRSIDPLKLTERTSNKKTIIAKI
jgi:hypothetical protein